MTRFFMLIPEAVQLILQATTIGSRREVFLLDMGKPVKIVDLAENMIKLAGYIPGKDIEIIYTGIRPGEKLHEELTNGQEGLAETNHKKIRLVRSQNIIQNDLHLRINELLGSVHKENPERLKHLLRQLSEDPTDTKKPVSIS